MAAKRLELLRELVPGAHRVAVLVNPANAECRGDLKDVEPAARAMGLQIQDLQRQHRARDRCGFRNLARERLDALFVGGDPLFASRRVQLAQSVGTLCDSRDIGYARGCRGRRPDELRNEHSRCLSSDRNLHGSILKGDKPADLPVVQSTKFELVINLRLPRCSASRCRRRCSPAPTR